MTINCHLPSEAHIVRTTLGSKAIRAIIDLSMHGVSKTKQIKLKRGGGTLLSTHAVVVMVRCQQSTKDARAKKLHALEIGDVHAEHKVVLFVPYIIEE